MYDLPLSIQAKIRLFELELNEAEASLTHWWKVQGKQTTYSLIYTHCALRARISKSLVNEPITTARISDRDKLDLAYIKEELDTFDNKEEEFLRGWWFNPGCDCGGGKQMLLNLFQLNQAYLEKLREIFANDQRHLVLEQFSPDFDGQITESND